VTRGDRKVEGKGSDLRLLVTFYKEARGIDDCFSFSRSDDSMGFKIGLL